jgi:hypothetical protein
MPSDIKARNTLGEKGPQKGLQGRNFTCQCNTSKMSFSDYGTREMLKFSKLNIRENVFLLKVHVGDTPASRNVHDSFQICFRQKQALADQLHHTGDSHCGVSGKYLVLLEFNFLTSDSLQSVQ